MVTKCGFTQNFRDFITAVEFCVCKLCHSATDLSITYGNTNNYDPVDHPLGYH